VQDQIGRRHKGCPPEASEISDLRFEIADGHDLRVGRSIPPATAGLDE